MNKRSTISAAVLAIIVAALAIIWLPRACSSEPAKVAVPNVGSSGLTFFVWSDQHVKRDGGADHLRAPIDAMNNLAGTDLPAPLSGKVTEPAFIFGCGDCTDWPSAAARDAFAESIARLKYPSFNILGNHDDDAGAPDRLMAKWIAARHGDVSYSFDCGGVHFIGLYSKFDPKQHLTLAALSWLKKDLSSLPPHQPVIIASHYCFEAVGNKDELADVFGTANVILYMGGHYHRATHQRYRGYDFIQAPSPTVFSQFWVIRVTPDRLLALVYDYKQKKWLQEPRVDVAIAGPASTRPAKIARSRPFEAGPSPGKAATIMPPWAPPLSNLHFSRPFVR